MKLPFVSVVVCTYNRRRMFEECLESLLNQSYPRDEYEIVVVDSSDDYSESLVKKYVETAMVRGIRLKYIYQKPSGIAAARNAGVNNAEGEIVCFIDDDCIADENWILNLIKRFNDGEKIGGVGGTILSYSLDTLTEKYMEKYFEMNVTTSCKKLNFIWTSNAAYRRDVILAAGGFDEHLKTHEDRDLSIRVRLMGYELAYAPHAIVYHRHRTTLSGLMKQQYAGAVGFMALNKKYPKHFQPQYYIMSHLVKVALFPLNIAAAMLKDNKRQHFVEQLLNTILLIVDILGMLRGLFNYYPGEKIYDEIKFLPRKSLSSVIRSRLKLFL